MGGGLVADDLEPTQKPERTLVLLGCSGNGKSATGNSILGREAFYSKVGAASVTKECELQTAERANGQIINVIDTPGLFSLFPSNESTIREILKCSHHAKEGVSAVLMVFSLRNRLTEEEKSAFFVLKNFFGSDIVDYMIVVFTNEDLLDDNNMTVKDYLKACSGFKEILTACNNRMVLFDNRVKASNSKKAKQVQELLNLVEVVSKNNKKPFMVDLSHETKVETKLIETASLLQKLTEEKTSRLEAEERANKRHQESSDEIKRLTEKLKKAEEKLKKAEEELEKKGGSCIIL